MIPYSVLDLSPITEGGSPAEAFRNSLALAQHAEHLGYRRFWLTEHHNMPGIASAATAVLIGHVAQGTKTIRVGSGGIMLPNHAPLVIAEQFGTLDSLFPGRIDLGLGRAPGTDQRTAYALRRTLNATDDSFPQDVLELQAYLGPPRPDLPVRAIPGSGSNVPIWLLGSSLYSAELAALLGLPFSFASHFAPDALMDALAVYRRRFRPSATLDKPYVMPAVSVFAAETDSEGRRLMTSMQQQILSLRRGQLRPLPPPVDSMNELWSPIERAQAEHMQTYAISGAPETVRQGLETFIAQTGADEVMIASQIYDHRARLRSFEIVAQTRRA